MSKLYAFDVDETIEVSNGPVSLKSMMDLRVEGHIVGVCGNWGKLCQSVTGWQHLISFFNCCPMVQLHDGQIIGDKPWYLKSLAQYLKADEYILVGNCYGEKNSMGFVCQSHDSEAAEQAGWRFIKEDSFAAGER